MMDVESVIARPSSTSTGTDFRPVSHITRGMWRPGTSERRTCSTPFQSSAQRAFSLKCENRNCQRTGGSEPAMLRVRAEHRPLFLDERLERRPLMHGRDEARELRPPLRIDAHAGVTKVHEVRRDADVGDREALADERVAVAQLALEIVEERRQLLVDRLLHGGLVRLLVEEARRDDAREEDLRAGDVHERGVAVLLEPERARVLVRIG